MEFLNNVGSERLGDALASSIDENARLSIISAYFTVFAYKELKEELSKIDEVRFLFSEPTFIKAMEDAKDPRQFELERRSRERGVGGVGLELTLSNNLDQRAIARECADWIRSRGSFRSARVRGAIQPGGTYVVENPDGDAHGFMGASAAFTQEGLGYEHRPGTVTGVSHFEGAAETDGEHRVYFVTETKGGKNGEPALRDAEKIKIGCAKKHFEALDLENDFHYNVRTTYQYEAVKA